MTSIQKIIKYLAIAFAIFLIVTIVSSIMSVGFGILKAAQIAGNNTLLEDLVTISSPIEEVSALKIELKGVDLKIEKGEIFEVKTNNSNIKYKDENGGIVIKEDGLFTFGKDYKGNVTISLPEDIKPLDVAKIEIGAGKIYIDYLNVQGLSLDLGAGELVIDNLKVTKEAKINGGAGAISINSGIISNMELDLGIGETNIKANITGESEINTGIGELNLNLTSGQENYKLDIDKGLGEIKFNGKSLSDDISIGTGENIIKINGGIGELNIKTNQF